MADQDGYAPNPSDKRFQNLIDAEFSASQQPAAGQSQNSDLDSQSALERQSAADRDAEAARHDYQGADASDLHHIGGSTRAGRPAAGTQSSRSPQSSQSSSAASSPGQNSSAQSSDSTLGSQFSQPNRWTNAVTGQKSGGQSSQKSSGFKGFLKKRLPTIAIILALAGTGTVILGGTSLQGFAMVNRMIQEFNSMGTVSHHRSNALIRRILSPHTDAELDDADPVKGTVFDYEKFNLGKSEVKSFKDNGITIEDVDLADGEKARILKYVDNDTEYRISSDADTAARIGDDIIDIDTAKATVPDFDTKYTTATSMYNGQNAGWYDRITTRLLSKFGLSRNRFADTTPDEDMDDFKSVAKSQQETDGARVEGEERDYNIDEDAEDDADVKTDENGDKYRSVDSDSSADTDKINLGDDYDGPDSTAAKKLTAKADAITKGAKAGVNISCTVMTVAGTLNDLANAAELIQVLNLANGFMNSVQQVQAGNGSNAQMSNYLTLFNTTDSTTGKTAMQAGGVSQLFGGTANANDESLKKYNFETSQHQLLGGAIQISGVTIDDLEKCNYSRFATSGASLLVTGGAIAFAVATGGVGGIAAWVGTSLVREVVEASVSAAITFAVSKVVEIVLPRVATFIARDLVSDVLGPDLGNAIYTGGRSYLGSNHKQRGGGGASEQAVAAFYDQTNTYIAHEATYARATKSPFDPTSPYTFLGSLYHSVLPFFHQNNLTGQLSSLSSIITGSVGKIMPTAAAQTMGNTYLTRVKGTNCPISDDMGVMSDITCSPIIVSDVDTFNMDPAELLRKVNSLNGNNFKHDPLTGELILKDGNPVINTNKNSPLFRFATYCGQRQVNYGFADATVTSSLSSTGSQATDDLSTMFGAAIDIIGDAQDLLESATNQANKNWISGLYCVNTPQNQLWDSEMKYYQRYLEDQGLLEGMGIVKESALVAALDEWDRQNPINTYEDLLAYYSGHTKAEVQLALDVVDYYQALAAYQPQNMAPLALEQPHHSVFQILFDAQNLTFIQVQQPLVAGTSELEREIAFRQDERTVYQSI